MHYAIGLAIGNEAVVTSVLSKLMLPLVIAGGCAMPGTEDATDGFLQEREVQLHAR